MSLIVDNNIDQIYNCSISINYPDAARQVTFQANCPFVPDTWGLTQIIYDGTNAEELIVSSDMSPSGVLGLVGVDSFQPITHSNKEGLMFQGAYDLSLRQLDGSGVANIGQLAFVITFIRFKTR